MIKKTNASEQSKNLMPISEEELNSAYGCLCKKCTDKYIIFHGTCCYKDCLNWKFQQTAFVTSDH